MGSEERIIPITRGERKPKQGSFAVIAGKTRVDVAIEAAQSIRRRPASLVELVKKQGHSGATPNAFTRSSNSLTESDQ